MSGARDFDVCVIRFRKNQDVLEAVECQKTWACRRQDGLGQSGGSSSTSNALSNAKKCTLGALSLAWRDDEILATGGGVKDRCLRLWRVDDAFFSKLGSYNRGLLASMETGAQITGIVFNSSDYFNEARTTEDSSSTTSAKPFTAAWQPDSNLKP